jgi:branched-subunit amino acid aminotransferase/4-amino-4-deoxychorismate lyase
MIIWRNGEISETNCSRALLGDGVFETLRIFGEQIFALDQHLDRLALASRLILISPPPRESITVAIESILKQVLTDHSRLRIIWSSDEEFILTLDPYIPSLAPLAVDLFSIERPPQPRIKSLSYGPTFYLQRLASQSGFDDYLLHHQGEVIEFTTSNLIYHQGGRWWTPPLNSGALAGITRHFLMDLFGVTEKTLTIRELPEVEAMASISSLREIQNVSKVGDQIFLKSQEVERLSTEFSQWRHDRLRG